MDSKYLSARSLNVSVRTHQGLDEHRQLVDHGSRPTNQYPVPFAIEFNFQPSCWLPRKLDQQDFPRTEAVDLQPVLKDGYELLL